MERVRFRGWEVSADVAATQRAYRQIEHGVAETCRCPTCRNFVLAREAFYPPDVRALFDSLGIDYRREAQLMYWSPIYAGSVHYYGWHHFVGDIEVMTLTYRPVVHELSVFFENDEVDLVHEAFGRQTMVQLEWYGPSPWLLPKPPPDRDHVEAE